MQVTDPLLLHQGGKEWREGLDFDGEMIGLASYDDLVRNATNKSVMDVTGIKFNLSSFYMK